MPKVLEDVANAFIDIGLAVANFRWRFFLLVSNVYRKSLQLFAVEPVLKQYPSTIRSMLL